MIVYRKSAGLCTLLLLMLCLSFASNCYVSFLLSFDIFRGVFLSFCFFFLWIVFFLGGEHSPSESAVTDDLTWSLFCDMHIATRYVTWMFHYFRSHSLFSSLFSSLFTVSCFSTSNGSTILTILKHLFYCNLFWDLF